MRGVLVIALPVLLVCLAGLVFGPDYAFGLAGGLAGGLGVLVLLLFKPGRRVQEERPEVDGTPPRLFELAVAAVAIRMCLAVVLNSNELYVDFAPDAGGYIKIATYIAASWEDPLISPATVNGYQATSFYQHFNAVFIYLFGDAAMMILSFVNAFVGTFAAWLFARLSFELYGSVASRRTFLLAAFFPSLVLWSSLNLRDVWSFCCIALALLTIQRLRRRYSTRDAVIFVGTMMLMPFIRSYMLALVGTGIAFSMFVVRIRRLPLALLAAAGLVVFLGVVSSQLNLGFTDLSFEENLGLMNRMRSGLASGSSAYDRDVDISTPLGALSYLPRGVSIFLLAPFPWSIGSWRQALALPETFVWYFILFQSVRGMWAGVRSRVSDIIVPLSVAAVITVAYGLVEGNEGTAYRHRAQVVLLCFVFAGGDYARRRAGRASEDPSAVPVIEEA